MTRLDGLTMAIVSPPDVSITIFLSLMSVRMLKTDEKSVRGKKVSFQSDEKEFFFFFFFLVKLFNSDLNVS